MSYLRIQVIDSINLIFAILKMNYRLISKKKMQKELHIHFAFQMLFYEKKLHLTLSSFCFEFLSRNQLELSNHFFC